MEEWKTYRLGDLCTIYGRIGFRGYTTEDLTTNPVEGAISLSPTNIVSGELDLSKPTYIKWNKYYESPEIMINAGDIIIVKTGSSVGRTTFIREVTHPMTLNPQLVVLKNIKTNPLFLSYLVKTREFQGALHSITVGSAIPTLSQKNLANLKVSIPSSKTQRRISDILDAIDEKILLNNRINHNLEEQAQALYKSWFVDFEPFKDGRFVDSEFGMIPEGWQINPAEDICPINIGKTPPRKESHWFSTNQEDTVWVSISDMADCGVFIDDSSERLTNDSIKRFNVLIVPKGSVLLSFKLTIGRVAIANRALTTNEAIARFIANDKNLSLYLYLTLQEYDYSKLGSTSSIATAVNSKIIKSMPVLWPGKEVIARFAEFIIPSFDEIRKRQAENRCLISLRDALIPELINGKMTC